VEYVVQLVFVSLAHQDTRGSLVRAAFNFVLHKSSSGMSFLVVIHIYGNESLGII